MERHLDEQFALRAPRLYRRLLRLMLALPPGCPIKRRALKRLVARGFEALARQDDALVVLLFHPETEINVIGEGFRALGFADRYHGHEGWRKLIGLWRAEWADVRYAPELVIDRGDRLILRVTATARGAGSGAVVTQTVGYVYDFDGGRILRQDFYWDWSECVAALALDDHV
jgi:ketosteroid isomerase-like protein